MRLIFKLNYFSIFAVNIPNIETGLKMNQFEDILRNFVRVRSQEYYKWKEYQYSIQYAGMFYLLLLILTFNVIFLNF